VAAEGGRTARVPGCRQGKRIDSSVRGSSRVWPFGEGRIHARAVVLWHFEDRGCEEGVGDNWMESCTDT